MNDTLTGPVPSTFQAAAAPPPAAAAPAAEAAPPAEQAAPEPLAAVASSALQAEATPPAPRFPTVSVTYGPHAYTVPASAEDWPMEVLEHIEVGRIVHGLCELLGPTQWRRFKSTAPTTREMGELFKKLAQACGFEGGLGE